MFITQHRTKIQICNNVKCDPEKKVPDVRLLENEHLVRFFLGAEIIPAHCQRNRIPSRLIYKRKLIKISFRKKI